jgi:hypothetical protein
MLTPYQKRQKDEELMFDDVDERRKTKDERRKTKDVDRKRTEES